MLRNACGVVKYKVWKFRNAGGVVKYEVWEFRNACGVVKYKVWRGWRVRDLREGLLALLSYFPCSIPER